MTTARRSAELMGASRFPDGIQCWIAIAVLRALQLP
jgi:hypothetical protein